MPELIYRHDWNFEEKPAKANFVTIDPDGNTATIANGAGLAITTVDAAHETGLKPANFLDIGGGANELTLLKAFEIMVEYKNLQAFIVNIFAGITRADEVAKAIVSAKKTNQRPIPIVCSPRWYKLLSRHWNPKERKHYHHAKPPVMSDCNEKCYPWLIFLKAIMSSLRK